MPIKASDTENGIVTEADPKVVKRAQWEAFEFELAAPGLIRVVNGSYADPSDHSYVVNGTPTACECPAFEYQDGVCKHMIAVGAHIGAEVTLRSRGWM